MRTFSSNNCTNEKNTKNSPFNIRGKDLNNLFIAAYRITNANSLPIMPEDFIENLEFIPMNNWDIVAIDNMGSIPNNINIEWRKTSTETYEMVPTLLNPGDSFKVNVLLSNKNYNAEEVQSNLSAKNNLMGHWSSRIRNIINIKINPLYQEGGYGPFVILYGMNLVFVLAFATLLSILTILILIKREIIQKINFKDILIIVFAFGISLSSSEVIGFYLFDQGGRSGYWINFPIIIVHTILLIAMLYPIIKKNIRANNAIHSDGQGRAV